MGLSIRFINLPILASILSILAGLEPLSLSIAAQGESIGPSFSDSRTPTSYCGIYCVHAIATSFDRSSTPESIIQEKYLSGRFGSTIRNLEQLASDIGLKSMSKQNLSLLDLQRANCPAILHVRTPGSVEFSHWILYLGLENNGDIRVYDPPRHTGTLSEAELLSIWDGAAIFVSDDQNHLPRFFFPFFILIAVCVSFAGFCITNRLSVHPKLQILIVTMTSVAITHICFPSGFLWNSLPQRLLFAAHQHTSHTRFSYEDIKELQKQGAIQFVDARLEDAFDEYRLPDAKNLPINSGILAVKKFPEKLDHGKTIIVYCQNKQCGWAHKIADFLEMTTLNPIGVFPGGVEEWYHRSLSE